MRVHVSALRPGMVLARDVTQGEQRLLAAGSVLSELVIEAIQRHGVSEVDVRPEDTWMTGDRRVSHVTFSSLWDYPEYVGKRTEIDRLFERVSAGDYQMSLLRYCVLRFLEEEFHASLSSR